MKKIHTAVMEEHRDAYYHWHRMIDLGDIPASGNYLLHIDHHDDMESIGYGWDMTCMPKNAGEALDFTDRCLGIADFIVPALWEKTFDTVHLLTELIPTAVTSRSSTISLARGSREFLVMNEEKITGGKRGWPGGAPWIKNKGGDKDSGQVNYTMKRGGLNDTDEYPQGGLVLDIDLDYFCWDNSLSTGEPPRIEITPCAYREFLDNRDHPLRILASRIIDVTEEDGKYWVCFVSHYPMDQIPDDEKILRRMDRLFFYFDKTGLRPSAIDICRSAKSGYLPSQKAEFVEKNFFLRLESMYPIEYI